MPIRPRTPPRQVRQGLWRHWTLWAWFAIALVFCLGGVSLWKSGRWLVHEDRFDHVRWAVVLAGESRDCERSDAAIDLYRKGKIDTLALSATRVYKVRYNSEFMVDYFVQQGVPRDRVFEFRQDAYSTLEEAHLLMRQFRLQNLDTVLIITTNYHTARTRRIFRKLAHGYPVVLVAAADYSVYDPNAWWSNRESLKIWFDEWARTFFTWFELARTSPENGKAEFQGLTPDIWTSRSEEASFAAVSEPHPLPAEPAMDSASAGDTLTDSAMAAADSSGEGAAAADSAGAGKSDSAKVAEGESKSRQGGKAAESKAAPKEAEEKKSRAKPEKKKASAPPKASSKSTGKKTEKSKSRK